MHIIRRATRALVFWLAELLAPVTFFLVAAAAAGLAWSLKDDGDLDGTGAVGLAVVVLIAVLIAFGGSDLLKRIKSIGPQGIELAVLSERVGRLPDFHPEALPGPGVISVGAVREFSSEQTWLYERGTNMLLDFQNRGRNVRDLETDEQADYRRIVTWVGRVAGQLTEFAKSLDILTLIADLPDLDVIELYALGVSHMNVALYPKTARSNDLLHDARRSLQQAVQQDEAYAPSNFALGDVNRHLGQYGEAVKYISRAIDLDHDTYARVNWNLAVSLVQNEDLPDALAALRDMPPDFSEDGWRQLYDHAELTALRTDSALKAEFLKICEDGAKVKL